ncbi:MBL fold metallo-hydrolase [Leptospira fainei]|uniref:MBL fold metallo-hydrolase n=1 Tax=Leptospira fainei TaxID=48782 RepID=UPI0005866A19|nr:MBL fold metallo-hydrolase [Leptospira fainei]
MKIKLYGVRGSLPTPLSTSDYTNKLEKILESASREFSKKEQKFSVSEFIGRLDRLLASPIGGNTTCIYVESSTRERLIIDCGSGMRQLGNDLLKEGIAKGGNISICLTHTHWDHIQGWPFFKPAYIPSVNIEFLSTIPNLKERLERQQHPENFPVTLDSMPSQKKFTLLEKNKPVKVGSFTITPFLLRHPGNCTGYHIEENGKSFLFCTDLEVREEDLDEIQELRKTFGKINLLVIDAQYSSEEAISKIGWGHTSGKIAVKCGEILGVDRLVLTHHEPDHSDEDIIRIFMSEKDGSSLQNIILAYEFDTFVL